MTSWVYTNVLSAKRSCINVETETRIYCCGRGWGKKIFLGVGGKNFLGDGVVKIYLVTPPQFLWPPPPKYVHLHHLKSWHPNPTVLLPYPIIFCHVTHKKLPPHHQKFFAIPPQKDLPPHPKTILLPTPKIFCHPSPNNISATPHQHFLPPNSLKYVGTPPL